MKKKMFLLTVLATLLVNGAEKSAISPEQIAYAPNDVKVVGVLRYGETSGPIEYSDTPPYRAFVFEGQGRDQIEVTVTGAGQNAFVAVADPALNVIASGTGHLSVSLPDRGPDTETFYVVFKDQIDRPAHLSVQLKKNGVAAVAPDTTH